ncbi:MAG: transporter [Fimbriimonas sp.]
MRIATLVLTLLVAKAAAGQSDLRPGFPITTDRPSFSDGTLIVPKGRVNLETGYTYFEAAGARTQTLPEIILRMPLADRLELRLVNLTYGDVAGGGNDLRGLLDPQIGFKLKLLDGVAGRRPDLALIAVTTLPIGSDDFRVDDSQPTFKVAWYQQATGVDGFGGNLNVAFLGPNRAFTQYAASLYWSRTLNAKTGTFLEVYRLMPVADGGPDANFIDAGVTYLLNPATQLDFRVGAGFDRGRDGAFVGAGVSFRF